MIGGVGRLISDVLFDVHCTFRHEGIVILPRGLKSAALSGGKELNCHYCRCQPTTAVLNSSHEQWHILAIRKGIVW